MSSIQITHYILLKLSIYFTFARQMQAQTKSIPLSATSFKILTLSDKSKPKQRQQPNNHCNNPNQQSQNTKSSSANNKIYSIFTFLFVQKNNFIYITVQVINYVFLHTISHSSIKFWIAPSLYAFYSYVHGFKETSIKSIFPTDQTKNSKWSCFVNTK